MSDVLEEASDSVRLAADLTCSVDQGPSLPTGRGGHAAGWLGENLVVAGGTEWNADRTVKIWHDEVLVLKGEEWVRAGSLPQRIGYMAYAQAGHRLVIVGGNDGQRVRHEVYLLDWRNGLTIEPLPNLPIAVEAAGCAVVNNAVYVFGGKDADAICACAFRLDLARPEMGWRELESIPGERAFPAVWIRGRHIHLIGGLGCMSPLTPLSSVVSYDTDRETWETADKLEIEGYTWCASPVDSTRCLLAGRADGAMSDGIWTVSFPNFDMQRVGTSLTPITTAPLVNINEREWWQIAGEPDTKKNRTPLVSRIQLDKRR